MRDSACHPSCIPAYQAFVPVWANARPFLYPHCTPGTCPSFSKHKILFLTHIVSWAPVPVWANTRLFTSTLHTKHLSQFHQTLDCSHQLEYHHQAYVPVCANTKPFHALCACTVCTVHGALFMVHCVLCSWCTVYTVHGALCALCVLFYALCAPGSVNTHGFERTSSCAKYKFSFICPDPFHTPYPSICPSLSKHWTLLLTHLVCWASVPVSVPLLAHGRVCWQSFQHLPQSKRGWPQQYLQLTLK